MSTLDLIEARLAELKRRLDELEMTAAALRLERDEMVTALKVVRRFSDDEDASPAIVPDLEKRRVDLAAPDADEAMSAPGKKPPGIPTIPEMVLEVLNRASLFDAEGLTPKEITAAIREQWWPEVRSESVGSIAWRMSGEGRLAKEGGRYRIPPEPSGELFARNDAAAERHIEETV